MHPGKSERVALPSNAKKVPIDPTNINIDPKYKTIANFVLLFTIILLFYLSIRLRFCFLLKLKHAQLQVRKNLSKKQQRMLII